MRTYLETKSDDFAKLFRSMSTNHKHYYYYWNLEKENQIEEFEKQYNDSYKLVYQGIIDSLKHFAL